MFSLHSGKDETMKRQSLNIHHLMVVLAVGLGLALAIGLCLAPVDPAQAQIVVYVDDDTCPDPGTGSQSDPFCRIQDAVDVALDGYEIRVAAGTYTGTQEVTIEQWEGPFTYTQVAIITQSLTLQGGYSPANWYTPDPVANPTIIDAERQGRGISIVGTYNVHPQVTVDGFTITGGDYTDLGNPDGIANQVCASAGADCGGGLYAYKSALTLRNSVIIDNIASRNGGQGGGIYVMESSGPTRIENTDVISNDTSGSYSAGGGLYAIRSAQPITITRSIFQDNAAPRGGGLVLDFGVDALVTISEVDLVGNHASQGAAGGVYIRLAQDGELLRMDRVRFLDNQAYDQAGALYLDGVGDYTTSVRLANLLFAGNRLTVAGDRDAIVCIRGVNSNLDVELAHVTAAANSADTFLYAEPSVTTPYTVNITLTNTLLSFFSNGFAAEEFGGGEVTIHHSHTLHQYVDNLHQTVGGSPTFTAVNALTGDPMLSPSYHLTFGSPAIDAGVDAGVDNDIDGDPRPSGDGFDIGADEFTIYKIYLPLVQR
jgi:hypothetical protein